MQLAGPLAGRIRHEGEANAQQAQKERRVKPDTQRLYQRLIEELRTTATLSSCADVLGWDEQTYLPPGGAEHRANQMSLLSGLVHERGRQGD